jgi:hypothetical protein
MNIIKNLLMFISYKNKVFKFLFPLLPYFIVWVSIAFSWVFYAFRTFYSEIAFICIFIATPIVFAWLIAFMFFDRLRKHLKIQIFVLMNFVFVRVIAYLLFPFPSYFAGEDILYVCWTITAIFFLIVLIELLFQKMIFIEWYFFIMATIVSNTLLIWTLLGLFYIGDMFGHSFPFL